MPADAYVTDADMKKVADAIRAKTGETSPLVFPDGMKNAIDGIKSGGAPERFGVTLTLGSLTSQGEESYKITGATNYCHFNKEGDRIKIIRDIEPNEDSFIMTNGQGGVLEFGETIPVTEYRATITKVTCTQKVYDTLLAILPDERALAGAITYHHTVYKDDIGDHGTKLWSENDRIIKKNGKFYIGHWGGSKEITVTADCIKDNKVFCYLGGGMSWSLNTNIQFISDPIEITVE